MQASERDDRRRWLRTWRAGRRDWRLQPLSIFSLAVAFVCLASALLVVTNLMAVRDRWSRAGRATVYLRDGATRGADRGAHPRARGHRGREEGAARVERRGAAAR